MVIVKMNIEMERKLLIEDDVLVFLDEIQKQMDKKIICCKCPNPCGNETSRCAVAMKNLLTDINMFVTSYKKHNGIEDEEQKPESNIV